MTTSVKLGRTTKIRQNFFFIIFSFLFYSEQQKFGRIFLCLRLIHHSQYAFRLFRYGSTRLTYPYLRSRLSSQFSPIDYLGSTRPRLSTFVPTHYASSSSFYSSFHLVCCFDILSTTVSLFALGPLGCAVYPMLTVGLTCTQLSRRLFCSGCATYPMLVVGVTCTLASRSFLFSPSCYFPAKFNVLISFAVVFCNLEPRHHFLPIGCRSSSSLPSSLSMSPRYRHCLSIISPPDPRSHSFSGFMAPLRILGLFSLVFRLRYCSVFSVILFPAQPGFVSASPFIPISAFISSLSISGVLAAQPAFSFLASVSSTVVLLPFYPSTSIDFRFPLSIAASTVLQSL
jgi:hypothetical protein